MHIDVCINCKFFCLAKLTIINLVRRPKRKMICYVETLEYDRLQQTSAPAPGPGGQSPGNLASWWHSENRIPTQIQVLLLLYVILVAIQTVFVWWRRCRSSAFIKYPLLLAYSLAQPVLAYTLVLLYYSSFKRSSYLLWYMQSIFVLGLGRVNSMTVYHVDDNKRYMTDLFQHVLFIINFVSMFIFLYKISWATATFQLCYSLFYTFIGTTNFGRIYAGMMASSFSDKGSLHLQEYMKTEHLESTEYDPRTLRGYNYLVSSGDDLHITVSEVWMSSEGILGGSEGTQLKEVCLSYALFQLLRRRFFGVACPEAKLPKTHDLIFKGLLLDVEENCQAYRIIETELAFAHDHFFTTSPSRHTYVGIFNVGCSTASVAFLYPYSIILSIKSFLSYKDVPMLPISSSEKIPGGRVGLLIRLVTMLLGLALELLQIYVYLSSDWAKVKLGCLSISTNNSCLLIYRHGHKLRQPFGHWQNKIGQHSLLKDLHSRSVTSSAADVMGSLFYVFQRFLGYVSAFPRGIHHPGVKEPDLIPLTNDVKLAIAQTLKASNGQLSNGISSLRRNNLDEIFSKDVLDEIFLWSCQKKIQATNLLIWHIATEYCDIAQSLQTAERGGSVLNHTVAPLSCFKKKQTIARQISNYCTYLMAFVPELLPDHHLETTQWFDGTRRSALDLLREDTSQESKYTKMKDYDAEQGNTAFAAGIRLGKKLEEIADDGRRWNILADLWTEMILCIAPSENAKDHIQHLANGGEFLTHLWALLTHAGILERDQHNSDQPRAENINTQNSVSHEEGFESSATHEGATSPDHLEMVAMHDSDSAVAPSRHRTIVAPRPPHWMRRSRSWNVFNSPARHGVDDDTLQLLPVLEITTANERPIDVSEASSSTQQTVPEQV